MRCWDYRALLTANIITSFTNLLNTLTKLHITDEWNNYIMPLSFVAKFTNLQEIMLSFVCQEPLEDFKTLQYVTFPQLQILKFQ